jgi:hypothetical protein
VNPLLAELGRRLADRWLFSVLPGLLWVCSAALARLLGWRHAVDPRLAGESITRWVNGDRPAGQITVLLLGALVTSAAAGLLAVGLATAVRRLWLLPGHRPPARWLVTLRRNRWNEADQHVRQRAEHALRTADGSGATVGPDIARALARRDAIALERPELPSWIGDRLRANSVRINRAYGLDLTIGWARLWTLLPESLRGDITMAQASYTSASTILAWAVLYAVVGLFWGPGLLIAAGLVVVGELRARSTTALLCELVETATDLYGRLLAEQLCVPCRGPLTPAVGSTINKLLRKEPLSGPPVADPVPGGFDDP